MPVPGSVVAAAVDRLRTGGVVAFPTETVYGLGADALNPRAIARVFELKGRPSHNPLIVHVAGATMARQVVAESAWAREADLLAAAFWPGPLSIVLPKAASIPAIATAGGPNVAVRCPDHPLALALLKAFGGPLVGPSANPSGRVSPTTAEHVRGSFREQDVMVLDGGPCRAGIESTVVSLVGRARILRPGLIGAAEISRIIAAPVAPSADGTPSGHVKGPLESPGMLESHYAPAAPALMFDRPEFARLLGPRGSGRPTVFVTWSGLDVSVPAPNIAIRLPATPVEYAAALYAALQRADAMQPSLIAVERPPEGESEQERTIWAAVMDRLRRACGPRA